MYKGSIELGRINKTMKLKFNLILDSNDDNFMNKLIRKFSLNGNDYLKLNPHPYATMDISSSSDKGEEWSSNKSVNLNRKSIFFMIDAITDMINNFTISNLFYYDTNKKLTLRKEVASTVTRNIPCGTGKVCRFQHCVVPDEDNPNMDYEGVVFMINHPENYCYLTIDELKFLRFELNKIDLTTLSILLIQTSILLRQQESEAIEIKGTPIQETIEVEKIEPVRFVPVTKPNEIPDLE